METPSKEILEFFQGAVAFVEANTFEQTCLWERWSIEAVGTKAHHMSAITDGTRYRWKEETSGYQLNAGTLNTHPVCFAVTKATLSGKVVIFWHPTSSLVDHDLITAYFDKIVSILKLTPNRVDAANFHNAIDR